MITFQTIAVICIVVVAYQLLKFLYKLLLNFIGPHIGFTIDITKMGKWAGEFIFHFIIRFGISVLIIFCIEVCC